MHAVSGSDCNRPEYDVLEKEVDESVADDWVWVSHYAECVNYVRLVMQDGDDVGMWLELLEEKHELELIEEID